MSLSNKKIGLILTIVLLMTVFLAVLAFNFFLVRPSQHQITLEKISSYANNLPEFPFSDNTAWLDPKYESFYRSRNPTVVESLLDLLDFHLDQQWSPDFLAELLQEVTSQNYKMGLIHGKNSFLHIKAKKPTTLYIFGDIHGAFHSFLRDLKYLKEKGVIDNNLALTNEYTYLIINGDAIDRSPYNIDTLTLITLLLKAYRRHKRQISLLPFYSVPKKRGLS